VSAPSVVTQAKTLVGRPKLRSPWQGTLAKGLDSCSSLDKAITGEDHDWGRVSVCAKSVHDSLFLYLRGTIPYTTYLGTTLN
jgi:hypothetical protein